MKKIMIVDDSLIIRMNLKKIFTTHGYEVVTEAVNGQDAVEKYTRFEPDLVTMDITMPILDGISALQKIRQLDSQASIVMISALGQELKIIDALNKGAKHYITKPFKENDVVSVIGSILNEQAEEPLNVCVSQ
jgi:two-component system, chemotaxis family, chemotaxis protein CheY